MEKKQVFMRNHGTYSVNALINLVKTLDDMEISTSTLMKAVTNKLWEEENIAFSPSQLFTHGTEKIISNFHLERIKTADMSWPIFIFDTMSVSGLGQIPLAFDFDIEIFGRFDVLDGLHRLSNAVYLTKQKYVKVKLVPWSILQKSKTDPFVFSKTTPQKIYSMIHVHYINEQYV